MRLCGGGVVTTFIDRTPVCESSEKHSPLRGLVNHSQGVERLFEGNNISSYSTRERLKHAMATGVHLKRKARP